MKIVESTNLTEYEKQQLFNIWNSEFPAKVGLKNVSDFELYFSVTIDPIHYLLYEDDALIGWAAKFFRSKDKWFSMLIQRAHQGKGAGNFLLKHITNGEKDLNGWAIDHNNYLKADGTVYRSPIEFYVKYGFEVFEDIRLFNGKINAIKIIFNKT